MCCSYAFNGMHLAQPTVMHFSTLLHHVECTWGALGARVRPTRILGPASGVASVCWPLGYLQCTRLPPVQHTASTPHHLSTYEIHALMWM
jgi:hypothetical protein